MNIFKEIEQLLNVNDIKIDYDITNKIENGQQKEVSKDGIKYSYTVYISHVEADDFLDAVNNDSLELALIEAIKMAKGYIISE